MRNISLQINLLHILDRGKRYSVTVVLVSLLLFPWYLVFASTNHLDVYIICLKTVCLEFIPKYSVIRIIQISNYLIDKHLRAYILLITKSSTFKKCVSCGVNVKSTKGKLFLKCSSPASEELTWLLFHTP